VTTNKRELLSPRGQGKNSWETPGGCTAHGQEGKAPSQHRLEPCQNPPKKNLPLSWLQKRGNSKKGRDDRWGDGTPTEFKTVTSKSVEEMGNLVRGYTNCLVWTERIGGGGWSASHAASTKHTGAPGCHDCVRVVQLPKGVGARCRST